MEDFVLFGTRGTRHLFNVTFVILGRTPKYVAPAVASLALVAAVAAPGQAAAAMTPAWPTTTVVVNNSRTVTGTVDPKQTTKVVLQQKVSGNWRSVDYDTPDADGQFSLNVPTWWLGTRDYRVVTDGNQESGVTTFSVKPTYSPAGKSTEHSYLFKTKVGRWDPCQVIGWRVNVNQATAGALADAKAAFHKLGQATGLKFRYRGTTSVIPQLDSNSRFPSDTQIVVAWARKGQTSMFDYDRTADAVGSPYAYDGYHNGDGTSAYRIVSGGVVIDSQLKLKAGYGTGITRGDILLHELGHVMGLGHYDSGSEIMNPIMTRGAARYGKGDLAGLEAHGAEMGCLYAGSGRTAGRHLTTD